MEGKGGKRGGEETELTEIERGRKKRRGREEARRTEEEGRREREMDIPNPGSVPHLTRGENILIHFCFSKQMVTMP